MKLHSQGPEFFSEAENAYNELFRSEIFTYEESLSETQRIELYGEAEDEDILGDVLDPPLEVPATNTDGAPSTLPQILYLAFKNHGQFLLDRLKFQLSSIEQHIRTHFEIPPSANEISAAAAAASSLKRFVEALDRDDTDLELWRLVSRIGGYLGSRRIARFCLEAVLDTDEGMHDSWAEPLGLEESFAAEQLKPLLQSLNDHLSKSQHSILYSKQKKIITLLKRHIDPCSYLPETTDFQSVGVDFPRPQLIKVPIRTWASCGKAILLQLTQEAQGIIHSDPGASYSLLLPPKHPEPTYARPATSNTNSGSPIEANGPPLDTADSPNKIGELSGQTTNNQFFANGIAGLAQNSPLDPEERGLEPAILNPNMTTNNEENEIERRSEVGSVGEQRDLVYEETGVIGPVSLPTRKRSSETAELPDGTDIGRSRSKRIKARESLADPNAVKDSTADDWSKWFEQQLQMYHQADGPFFQAAESALGKLGSKFSNSLANLKNIMSEQVQNGTNEDLDTTSCVGDTAARDLKKVLNRWNLGKSKAILTGHDLKTPNGGPNGTPDQGFTAFLEHSYQETHATPPKPLLSGDDGLEAFTVHVQQQSWMPACRIGFKWIVELLWQFDDLSRYQALLWPDALKETVVQMLVNQDENIYSEISRLLNDVCHYPSDDTLSDDSHWPNKSQRKWACTVQAIFEIHLDVYGRITNPSSLVDIPTRLMQRDRLSRWATLASQVIRGISNDSFRESESSDHLEIRYLWAHVVYTNLLDPSARDYTIACFQELLQLLTETARREGKDRVCIELLNNAIMPEVSVDAAEKEISKLTTMDFFMTVFSSDNNDPLAVIESLEPLLDMSTRRRPSSTYNSSVDLNHNCQNEVDVSTQIFNHASNGMRHDYEDPKLLETLQFLDRTNVSLRLFLWQKLRDAYSAINYPPQVFCSNLRSFILIINYLRSSAYEETATENRHDCLLRWLHKLDELAMRMLRPALSDSTAFDCVDGDHIRASVEAVAILQKILHVFALWEDTIRVGQVQPPVQVSQAATKAQMKATDKIRDMIVKIWILQYTFMKEAMAQNRELFSEPNDDLIKYLKLAHQALGLRFYCPLANKAFLKLMKSELEKHRAVEGWDIDMAQVILDLYGLKISSGITALQDHGCQSEDLDRHTALEIMDLVMLQVNRISIKDLLKCDLKFTVDKMQQIIKVPKAINAPARVFNRRLISNYLRLPINPIVLYRSLQGIGGPGGNSVGSEGSDIVAKGWYFLLGHIALAKFRSQKRSSPGSTDDLDIASTFLGHDLEFDTEKWETWYRLAQVYDTLIEEDATWSAEKLDNKTDDLVALQRKSIHCYTMAVAVATRCADVSFENASKIADLYADFGSRIYAASREPFSMKAFRLDEFERHYNGVQAGMYKRPPFRQLYLYPAWKFSSVLLRKASTQKPQSWM